MNTLTEWTLHLQENVGAVMKKLGVDTDAEVNKLDKLQSHTKKVGEGFTNLQGLIIGAGVGIFAGQALEEYEQAAAANAQLKASYISTNGAVGKSYEDLQKISDKLAATSIYDDDDITKAQSVLLTFTNIHGEIYEKAMPAVADLATKMGGDLQGATVEIGKALNNPIEGITALTRVGVSFSDQQKGIIDNYVKIGDTADAQKMIIAELNKEFGGSAQAALDANPMLEIHKQFKELQETVGGVIMKLIVELKPAIITVVNVLKTGVDWMVENWTTISDVFSAVYEGVKIATLIFSPFLVVMALTEAAVWAQNLAWLANPLIWIPALIVGVIASFTYLYRKVDWFRGGVTAIFAGLKAYFFGFFTFMKDILGGIGTILQGVFTLDLGMIEKGLDMSAGAYAKYATNIKDAVVKGYNDGVKEVRDGDALSVKPKDKIQGAFNGPINSLVPVGDETKKGAKDQLADGVKGVSEGGKQVRNVTVNISKMADIHINTGKLTESMAEIKRIVEETIVRAVNGSELALQ